MRSVLVIDDDPDCADITCEALRAAGHQVQVAKDANDAVSRLGAMNPDVVLIDSFLGPVDGIALVRALRGSLLASTRVLLTTGRSPSEVRGPADAAGIEDILIKPIELGRLLDAVTRSSTGWTGGSA